MATLEQAYPGDALKQQQLISALGQRLTASRAQRRETAAVSVIESLKILISALQEMHTGRVTNAACTAYTAASGAVSLGTAPFAAVADLFGIYPSDCSAGQARFDTYGGTKDSSELVILRGEARSDKIRTCDGGGVVGGHACG
jgi:hypothetical protein